MAQEDLTLFDEFANTLGTKVHDLANDAIWVALIETTVDPTAADATPQLADYTEVATGNGYVTGGLLIDNTTWTQQGALWRLDGDDVTWLQNASGPTDIHWAIIYNYTTAGNECIGFVEMGNPGGTTPISLQNGDISINWSASGILTVNA